MKNFTVGFTGVGFKPGKDKSIDKRKLHIIFITAFYKGIFISQRKTGVFRRGNSRYADEGIGLYGG